MATKERWEMVEQWASEGDGGTTWPCLLDLRARVEALEAAQNLRQQDESAECAAPPNPMDSDLLQHWREALGDSLDRLRAVYDLGRKHGAFANSKPTPNDRQIGSSADTGLLPMIVSETGSDDEPETERIICSAISGGADYVNGMPRELSLERIRYGLHIGSLRISARYVQAPAEVTEPTPAPVVGLVERLIHLLGHYGGGTARAAIREVADWLEQQQEVPIGSTASADYFAAMLREEAGR